MLHRRLAQAAAAAAIGFAAFSTSAQGAPSPSVQLKPADIQWKPDPRAPGLETAVLSGDPKQAGLYVIRVKLGNGAKLQPHTHPDTRYTTVLSGEVQLGFGETFDPAHMKVFPAGSFVVVPANAPHFAWQKNGEAIVQDVGTGPTGSTPVAAK